MKKVIEQLVDDLSGETIEAGSGQTVLFSFEGKSYEIDLSDKNADKFRKAVEPYVARARRVSGAQTPRATAKRSGSTGRASHWSAGYSTVREWAQANGIEVSAQGRVADSVMQAYEDAHK